MLQVKQRSRRGRVPDPAHEKAIPDEEPAHDRPQGDPGQIAPGELIDKITILQIKASASRTRRDCAMCATNWMCSRRRVMPRSRTVPRCASWRAIAAGDEALGHEDRIRRLREAARFRRGIHRAGPVRLSLERSSRRDQAADQRHARIFLIEEKQYVRYDA